MNKSIDNKVWKKSHVFFKFYIKFFAVWPPRNKLVFKKKKQERNLNDKTDKTEIANHIGPHLNMRSVCPIFENELSLHFNKPVIIIPQFIKCI